jgi:hypothetical protein
VNKIERVLSILEAIPYEPRWSSVKLLQASFENRGQKVSARTLQRDIQSLEFFMGGFLIISRKMNDDFDRSTRLCFSKTFRKPMRNYLMRELNENI